MPFRAGCGAVWILRILLLLLTVLLSLLLWLPARVWELWSPWCAALPFLPIIPVWIRYLPRLSRSLHGRLDGGAVRACYGILWRRELFVPVGSLRTFEIWTPPLHRLFRCRTVILRFAGGSAWLPLLDWQDAYALAEYLEQAEETP